MSIITPTTQDVPHPAVVALPPQAVTAEDWQPDTPHPYRVFEGEQRSLEDGITVWAHGVQYPDGRIDDGRDSMEAPGISVDGVYWEKSLSSETARRLADLLVMAADEVDRWVTR